jgi:hypothetical protein
VAEDDRGPPFAQEPERAGQMLGRWLALVRADVVSSHGTLLKEYRLRF